MHRSNVVNAATLHHWDGGVDHLHHCSRLVFVFSVSMILSNFKENLLYGISLSGCFDIYQM